MTQPPHRLLTAVAAVVLLAGACGDSEPADPSGDATLSPATAPLATAPGTAEPEPTAPTAAPATTVAAPTAAPATTVAAPAAGDVVEVAPGLAFSVDTGTATAAVSLSEVEADELIGDELLPFDAIDVQLDDCAEIFPFNYALRFSIDETVAFDYPVELVVTMYSLFDDLGFPLDPQLVTVSGPGTFTTVHSARRPSDDETLDPLIDSYFEEFSDDCGAEVVDPSGSGLGHDLLTDYQPPGTSPQQPLEGAPAGTLQHLAETADWTAKDDPWRVLARTHGIVGTGFFAERVLLPSEGWILEQIKETIDDDCYAVETSFRTADPNVTAAMVQYRGSCAVPELFDTLLVDGDWTVVGAATAIDEFAAVLAWFESATPRDPDELDPLREFYP